MCRDGSRNAKHPDKSHGPGLVLPDSHQGKTNARVRGQRIQTRTSCMDIWMSLEPFGWKKDWVSEEGVAGAAPKAPQP